MANKSVALMVRGKTNDGWKHLHVIVGRNGKIKPGVGRAKASDTKEIPYTQGYYELRFYKGTNVAYENVGDNPSDALASMKNYHIKKAVKEGVRSFAEEAGITLPDRKDKAQVIDLNAKGIEFLHDLERRGKARAAELWIPTIEGYIEATGVTTADAVTQQSVLDYHAALLKRGNAERTVYNRHVSLFQFFAWLGLDRKKLGKVPGSNKTITPEYLEKEVSTYTPNQMKSLFAACRDDYDRVVFNLLLKSGLRMAEAMHLDWFHVDFESKVIRVREDRRVGQRIKDKTERSVPMPDDLIELLQAWREDNPTTKLVIGTDTDKPNRKLLRMLKRIVNAAKLNCGRCDGCTSKNKECGDWYLHKFRATYTTTLLRNGVDIRTVMEYTGHADMTTVMRYLRPAESHVMQSKISNIKWM
jgi:integrase